jgi:hypothetical protein
LVDTSNLDWISLNSTNSQITIYTSNKNYLGFHQLVLVQSFDDFPEVNPFISFKLRIVPAPDFADQGLPPYFEKELFP